MQIQTLDLIAFSAVPGYLSWVPIRIPSQILVQSRALLARRALQGPLFLKCDCLILRSAIVFLEGYRKEMSKNDCKRIRTSLSTSLQRLQAAWDLLADTRSSVVKVD